MPRRPRREILTIEKPPDWSDEDWDRLTPAQKVKYASNPSLYRPGQSGRQKAAAGKPRTKRAGRPRKDGLPPISAQTRAVVIAEAKAAGVVQDVPTSPPPPAVQGDGPEVTGPSFPVAEAETVKEAVEVNGLALIQDAYRRAARAASSGDPFDRAVYLTLIGKAHPMATIGADRKALSGEAKKRKKALEAVIASLGMVEDASFTPVPPQGQEDSDVQPG